MCIFLSVLSIFSFIFSELFCSITATSHQSRGIVNGICVITAVYNIYNLLQYIFIPFPSFISHLSLLCGLISACIGGTVIGNGGGNVSEAYTASIPQIQSFLTTISPDLLVPSIHLYYAVLIILSGIIGCCMLVPVWRGVEATQYAIEEMEANREAGTINKTHIVQW